MEDLKREEIIPFITAYYDQIGRPTDQRPNYFSYSLLELKKCLYMFGITLVRENTPSLRKVDTE
jgi:hypothetical protein